MKKYLKPRQYYVDLYDRYTVEECRSFEKIYKETIAKNKNKINKLSPEEIKGGKAFVHNLTVYFRAGDRYERKEGTIQEWMQRDKARDEKLENAKPLDDIKCKECGEEMFCEITDLHYSEPEKVLFLYHCSSCKKGRGFFDDGTEYITKRHCPKCNATLDVKHKREGNKITTIDSCLACDYKEESELDLSEKPKKEKLDPNFERDKRRFCLNEEQGQQYLKDKQNLQDLSAFAKEIEEKEKNKRLYDKVAKLKKFNIAELKELLNKELIKEDFNELEFSKTDTSKDVVISFNIQDTKAERGDYDSRKILKSSMQKTLLTTNWRLMSEGVDFRLGVLSGRLRGYEKEEDLIKLVG